WWDSGDYGDTNFSTIFPPNFFKAINPNDQNQGYPQLTPRQNNFSITSTSFHPGGCNFAFCDGSVRFLKDSVRSWNPKQVQLSGDGTYSGVGGAPLPAFGVYQALSTRNGGEIISSDAY